ncbi:MAG: hypothetical protein GY867_03835, partial [bacterium]|nr:hypothetical protein [bacterium]
MDSIKDKTAIVGVGVVDFSTDIGMSEWDTASQCVLAAIEDAGLKPADIDCLVKNIDDAPDNSYIQKSVGIENLAYASESHWGTSAMINAVTAVASGAVNYAVYYQAAHRASGLEKSYSDYRAARDIREDNLDMIRHDFYDPFGLIGQPSCFALTLRRYIHEFGITSEQLGWIPVVFSEYAARNPEAIFYDRPVSIEDYMKSSFIADPIRAMECAPQVDGAMAIVVSTAEKAKSLRQSLAFIMSVAQGTDIEGQLFSSYNQEVITQLPEMRRMGAELFRVAGITPKDISSAQLDDTFTPLVAMQLESLGFCAP